MKTHKRVIFSLLMLVLMAFILAFFVFRNLWNTEQSFGKAGAELTYVQIFKRSQSLAPKIPALSVSTGNGSHRITVRIADGETAHDAAQKLTQAGLITDAQGYLDLLIYKGYDRKIQVGAYRLHDGMNAPEIAALMADVSARLIPFAFLGGMRLEEIARLVDGAFVNFSGTDFLLASKNYASELHPTGGTSLEGYLIPGEYDIPRDISLDSFLGGFVMIFEREVTQTFTEAFAHQGISVAQAVILSSMIAREALDSAEYPLIASVFYNRLAQGIPFASDPTAQYAIGWDAASQSYWKMPLTTADVSIQSPYNTYITNGFPPGPICNPPLVVYAAVAQPAKSDYLFFRLRCDGSPNHAFSRTYAEHIAAGCP